MTTSATSAKRDATATSTVFHTAAAVFAAAGVVALCAAPDAGLAHHSRTEFADTVIEMEGELTGIVWRNPHPIMQLAVEDDSGEETVWQLEVFLAANSLDRENITADLFTIGQRIRVAGQPSTRRDVLMLKNVLRGDGTEIRLSLDPEPFWPDSRLVNVDPPTGLDNEAYTEAAIEAADGIFRVWTVVDWIQDRTRNRDLPLTAAARAKRAQWDELTDEPQMRCEPPGLPGAMTNPLPIEFLRDGENIVIRLEEFETTRTIHMNPQARVENLTPSIMGYSIGRWEGPSLVVETTSIDYPYLDQLGAPQSTELEFLERFTLSDDETTLEWESYVTDPVMLTEPANYATTRWTWIPGRRIRPWDCLSLDSIQ